MSRTLTRSALPLVFAFAACAGEEVMDEADEIGSAIEEELGGFNTDDEAQMFGDEGAFAEAALEAETLVADPLESSAEVTAAMNAPDAVLFNTLVLWGQMPPDWNNDQPRVWSGTISISRGALIVRRSLGFEDRTDRIEPRTDLRSVRFDSMTLPHMDGLRLTIVDPTPGSDEPLVVTYTLDDGATLSAPMADLVDGPVSLAVDEAGNRIVAVAMPERADPCAHGTLRGRWHKVRDGRGRFIGRVDGADGEPEGHIRGVYGRRADGEQVFFGKYIDLDGRFRGIFGGGYRDGHFAGRWLVRGPLDHGVLAGEYRETIRGPETGGHFLGRWAETSCNLRLDR